MRTNRAWVVFKVLVCLVIVALALPAGAGNKKREKHVDRWPQVDLVEYPVLVIEEFRMTDPKAPERKKGMQVENAPRRLADYLQQSLGADLFAEIRRGETVAAGGGGRAVILRGEITQYKPGSAVGRAMLAGAGSAHLDFVARLIDAETGRELTSFDGKRTWAWGGAVGASKGVDDIERNVARELALYLERCKRSGA